MRPTELKPHQFVVVVIAASAGGITAISQILGDLAPTFVGAVAIVQHRADIATSRMAETLTYQSNRLVLDAHEGDQLEPGRIFLAPGGCHLLINPDESLSLSHSAKVRYSRPAADRLFQTGAQHLGKRLVAVVLTGYDGDGSDGIEAVKRNGGSVIAQDQASSQAGSMPASAVATGFVDWILPLGEIGPALNHFMARALR